MEITSQQMRTGCVHTAPGHGEDDYIVGQKYDLPVISPLNDKGVFTEEGTNLKVCSMTKRIKLSLTY